MVIIDTRFYAGELYVMLENGDIIHVITRGKYNPAEWEYEMMIGDEPVCKSWIKPYTDYGPTPYPKDFFRMRPRGEK